MCPVLQGQEFGTNQDGTFSTKFCKYWPRDSDGKIRWDMSRRDFSVDVYDNIMRSTPTDKVTSERKKDVKKQISQQLTQQMLKLSKHYTAHHNGSELPNVFQKQQCGGGNRKK